MRLQDNRPRGAARVLALALALAAMAGSLPHVADAGSTAGCGILVSTTGTDGPTCGVTSGAPCRTISYGIQRAVAEASDCVFVQAGVYDEVLVLAPGVDVTGGFDAAWTPGPYDAPGHETRVVGGFDAGTSQYLTVRAHALGSPVRLAELVLQGPHASGAVGADGRSSYVVHASAATLTLSHALVQAGNGSAGLDGANGLDAGTLVRAAQGGVGGNGQEYNTVCDVTSRGAGGGGATNACAESPSASAMAGGTVGAGGTMDTDCGWSGSCGVTGNCDARAGLAGGQAAFVLGLAGTGGPGGPANGIAGGMGHAGAARNGAAGSAGSGGALDGSGFWSGSTGGAGVTGENGGGGGGGGGAGGNDDGTDAFGAGGGGGGAGGCAAREGGTGGGGGGASIGLAAVNGSVLTLENCTIESGTGGAGGAGGSGGRGQPGGLGGLTGAYPGAFPAGSGGRGGHGGHGGGGGGGAGGYSIGILSTDGAIVNTSGLVVSGGSAGTGGAGGLAGVGADPEDDDGNEGPSGAAGTVATSLVVAGVEPELAARPARATGAHAACDISCVLDAPGPAAGVAFSFDGVMPNPVSNSSLVRFGLPEEARVTIEVFDLVGRRVSTLADGTFPAGRHAVRWAGVRSGGQRAAAGVYVLRFSGLGRTLTRTAVVVP